MQLREIISDISGFSSWSHVQKIKFFGWYLHSKKNQSRFGPSEIRTCYDELHLQQPTSVSSCLAGLLKKKPSELLRDKGGYYLARQVSDEMERKYGQRISTVQVDKLLSELPGKISDEAERLFLSEALICFRQKAFRASIVMSWNLAYFHLEEWIFNNHLASFNSQLLINFKKPPINAVSKRDDFSDLKESQVIEVCCSAGIITGNLKKILSEKLTRRNISAHPSLIEITQLTAEEFITDLVSNVVLKLV